MTATFTTNREVSLGALWWLYQGATFGTVLADTTGASPAPALTDPWSSWLVYALDSEFDLFFTGGTVAYDATQTSKATLPLLEIELSYASAVSYTDVLIYVVPAISPGASPPDHALPFVGVIHEPSLVTLNSGSTKTYNLNLFAQPD
ncbi:hypothetical protein EBT31_13295 [bacterium]|jgi:hypothetical protein|nr:hypothetical protein [bacterium]